ncbi:hypothetical protein NL676_013103 [Syzygium grande]|nr:hypothetical protein NL676_013103 [Syzygium grande]
MGVSSGGKWCHYYVALNGIAALFSAAKFVLGAPCVFKLSYSRQNLSPSTLDRYLITHLNGGHLRKAISHLNLMSRDGSHPDLLPFSLLNSCICSCPFMLGRRVYRACSVQTQALTRRFSTRSSISTQNPMIGLRRRGFLGTWVIKRDLVSWSSMISCYANSRMEFEAVDTFVRMLEDGFFPSDYVSQQLSGVFRCGECINRLDSDVCVGCALIDMFAKGSIDLFSS